MNERRDLLIAVVMTIMLASCGGGGGKSQYSIGGTVSGLLGSGLVLQATGVGTVMVSSNGPFQFPTAVAPGTAYTVTVQTQPTNPSQTCSVAGTAGSGTVAVANVTNIAVTCSTNTYKVGGTVTGLRSTGLTLQNNGGDSLQIATDGSFTFATSAASGSAYVVTIQSQPTPAPGSMSQICTVRSGVGTVGGADVTSIGVVCGGDAARFIYVVNHGSNNVSGYTIDNVTGALTAMTGSPFAAGDGPVSLTMHPSGQFAYVSNGAANTISAYTIDATGGAFAPISGSPILVTPVSTVQSPIAPVEIDPSGRLAIVGNPNAPIVGDMQPNNLAVYRIDAASGMLTPVVGSPFTTNSVFPDVVTIDPAGKFVYAFNYGFRIGVGGLTIASFAIDSSVGTLTAVSGSPFGPFQPYPTYYAWTPNRSFAYEGFIGGFQSFILDGATGAVTAGATTPFVARTWVVAPSGRFLYVADDSAIGGYAIDSTSGAPTLVSGMPVTLSNSPGFVPMTVDPLGRFLYATATDGIYVYAIDASDGALTIVPGSPFAVALPSDSLATALAIDPSGRFAYAPSRTSSRLYAWVIDPLTGALTPVTGSPFTAGTSPGPIVFLH